MLHWVLGSCGNVTSLTCVVAHGFLCHQLDAAPSHHIMELGQEQEPVGAKGRAEKDGRLGKAGRLGQPQSEHSVGSGTPAAPHLYEDR